MGGERENKQQTERRAGLANGDEEVTATRESNDNRIAGHSEHDVPLHPELEWKEQVQGRQPGNRYVRYVRPHAREFRRRAPGHLVATERVLQPSGPVGRVFELIRSILIGRRLRSEQEIEERTGKLKGLAIFASDNISSSAYATEEIMRVLVLASVAALTLTIPITIAIVVILAIVVVSYRQVIRAYPGGGGSYVVAHENLGPLPGLAAAAALLTDYILTVAVSVSAGVAAITSAFPELFDQRVIISVMIVIIMTILNLRGIRESGNIFAVPTYVYLVAILGLIGIGLFRTATGTMPSYEAPPEWAVAHASEPLALLLILRAFASGSVALTGTEAVSNGVPAFKPPEIRNAQIVLVAMGTLFGTIFLGISILSSRIGIIPDPAEVETVVSQLTRILVGGSSPYYYLVQFSTALLLVLAANTAFNGFPRLATVLAADGYLPRQFAFRGDRLAFTVGIVVLALLSASLIVIFGGSVTSLIPLYTVGVFLAFTLSQFGLVLRWWRRREEEPGWRQRAITNAVGGMATGVVAVVVAVSKFALGAWMVLVLIPIIMAMMWGIQRHYRIIKDALTLDHPNVPLPRLREPRVIVPVSHLDRATLQALAYAQSISNDVTAVHITDNPETAQPLKRHWETSITGVRLVIVESPYRALIGPLLAYIDALEKQDPRRPITLVLSQFVPSHFWEWFLHNQTTLRLKMHLFFRRNTIVIDIPYRVEDFDDIDEGSYPEGG